MNSRFQCGFQTRLEGPGEQPDIVGSSNFFWSRIEVINNSATKLVVRSRVRAVAKAELEPWADSEGHDVSRREVVLIKASPLNKCHLHCEFDRNRYIHAKSL